MQLMSFVLLLAGYVGMCNASTLSGCVIGTFPYISLGVTTPSISLRSQPTTEHCLRGQPRETPSANTVFIVQKHTLTHSLSYPDSLKWQHFSAPQLRLPFETTYLCTSRSTCIISRNRLSLGCVTMPRRQSVIRVGLNNAATFISYL